MRPFERFGTGDIDRAVALFRVGLTATAANSPERAKQLAGLGNGLRTTSNEWGVLDDLNAAIEASSRDS